MLKYDTNLIVIGTVIFMILLAFLSTYLLRNGSTTEPVDGSWACTADAKLCPDGSSVGRTPPYCQFAPCPR